MVRFARSTKDMLIRPLNPKVVLATYVIRPDF